VLDSEERFPPPRCHPGTREEILNRIHGWIDGTNGTRICWLHGPAGAGKSAIAQTVAENCATRQQLAASFFFSRLAPLRCNAQRFFITLALQLAHSIPDKRSSICRAVEKDLQLPHKQHALQMKQLIVEPLLSPPGHPIPGMPSKPFLVIVDGLDECDGNADQIRLLSHIFELVEIHRLPLRFLIVSRPEPHIQHFFDDPANCGITPMSLYGDHQARDDVYAYLRDGFNRIYKSERHASILAHVPEPWPPDHVVRSLAIMSGGYFIHASTVIKYVDEEHFSCVRRLEDILKIHKPESEPFAELDKLYIQILSISSNTELLIRVLGFLFVRNIKPLNGFLSSGEESMSYLEALLELRPGEIMLALRGLRSVLDFAPSQLGPILDPKPKPFHVSFTDFLFDESRAGKYYIDRQGIRADIVRCTVDFIGNYAARRSVFESVTS
jgi:hypothetical protein